MPNIQWFPGHMARTRRKISEDLKMVDIVAEIVDARIPVSSANPVLSEIIQNKPRVILLSKSDLADPSQTKRWVNFYLEKGLKAIPLNVKNKGSIRIFVDAVKSQLQDQMAAWRRKGMTGRPIRVMVVGVPNSGKSSLINLMLRGSRAGRAEVRDKPGVTRQNQWFSTGSGLEFLDTPGILWPKFEDQEVGVLLALTGAVKEEILDVEALAYQLIDRLIKIYPRAIEERYDITLDDSKSKKNYEILEEIGKKRGMMLSGGLINSERAAIALLDEFRAAKLGRITLEQVK